MKSALLRFGVLLLLGVPGWAQMRSTISGGPIRVGRPHPPAIFTRPDFGRRFHGNRFGFGTILYPSGFYDAFYDEPYAGVVGQRASVVIVRDEGPPLPPAPPLQVAPEEPRMIEVPEATVTPSAGAKIPATIFILSDGRRLEARNYTITDSLLTIKEPRRPAMKFPVAQLNIDATIMANRQRGLDLRLPENRSEILLGF